MANIRGAPHQQEVEEKEQKLRKSIAKNYSHIKSVENQLAELQLQLNLTSGPKKSALEMLRRKIETKNELVAAAKQKFAAAKQVADEAEEALRGHERSKEQLCQELNLLVHQSATAELSKLEQLTKQLESLNGGKLADPGNRLLGREDQQAVASQSSAAEHTAAASSTLDSVLPPSTAHNRASSSQQDHAPAKSSNAARPAAKEPAQAGQHSSQRQRAKELPCNAQNPSNVTKTNATINHSHLLRQAKSSDVAALQAASNTAGRFTGFA